MGSPANLTLGPQVSTVTSAIETTLNCAASSSAAAAEAGHRVEEVQKLAVYLSQLQEERGKIESFKRELPLCMQLLETAIETAKQRVTEDQCSPTASLQTSVVDAQDSDSERSKRTPILENFMPLKRRWEKQSNQNDGEEEEDQKQQQKIVLGRPAWMGEAQLWTKHSPCMDDSPSTRRHMDFSSGIDQAKSPLANARLMLSSKHRQGGAFVPFNRERQLISPPFSPPLAGAVPDAASLSLSTSAVPTASQNGHTNGDSDVGSLDVRGREQVSDARVSIDYPAQTRTAAVQPQRKARRCWSPELHRRFVSALHQLGGSQVATPKQIRELMKVDGLTNDEVKSHLQKYRLHTRRSSPSPSPSSHAPQLLILGWVPPECSPAVGAASQASTGGVCDDPPAIQQEHTPPQSLQGAFPGGGECPHSSSDSYVDESDDEQEGKSTTTSSPKEEEEQEQKPLQSKGSTTCLPDVDTLKTQNNRDRSSSAMGKLQTFRKAKAAA